MRTASAHTTGAHASPLWPRRTYSRSIDPGVRFLVFTGRILDWLEAHPGDGWQARWRATGADQGKETVSQEFLATISEIPSATV
jgi:hypothetical protein